jgi:hypothetical protein
MDLELVQDLAVIIGAACVIVLLIAGLAALFLSGEVERSTERLERKLRLRGKLEDGDQ